MKELEQMIFYAIFWIVFAVLIGFYAKKQNRNISLFVLLSFIITPIWGFIILSVVGKKKRIVEDVMKYKNIDDTTFNVIL